MSPAQQLLRRARLLSYTLQDYTPGATPWEWNARVLAFRNALSHLIATTP